MTVTGATDTETRRGSRWRIGTLAVAGLALLTVAGIHVLPRRSAFCQASEAFITVDGRVAVLEDQGSPGRDGCDAPTVNPKSLTLGFDCDVRTSTGTVIKTLPPNRKDGTCGKGDPGVPRPR